jgi:purine-cytosine permease-like protein
MLKIIEGFKLSYIPWIIGILIAGYFLFRAIKRIIKGIISYRKLGKEEFIKRLKDGFDSITPTQRARGELKGIVISLFGMVLGVIILAIFRIEKVWFWAEFSLIGGSLITVWQLIGKLQQYRMLKKQDKIMEELNKENKEDGKIE